MRWGEQAQHHEAVGSPVLLSTGKCSHILGKPVGTDRERTWSHSSPSLPQASSYSQVKPGLAVCAWFLLYHQLLILFSTSPATYTRPDTPSQSCCREKEHLS